MKVYPSGAWFGLTRKRLKWALYALAALSIIVLTLVTEAHIFKFRAQHLLIRVSELDVGQSTSDDANQLRMDYGHTAEIVEFRPKHGDTGYSLILNNLSFRYAEFEWLRRLGVRPARVVVNVILKNGHVNYWSYHVLYRTAHGHVLDGETSTSAAFRPYTMYHNWELLRHPGYAMGTGNITTIGGGMFVETAVTPQASPTQIKHARHLNLNCLTRIPDCNFLPDLMPDVINDIEDDYRWETEHSAEVNAYRTRTHEELEKKCGPLPWNEACS